MKLAKTNIEVHLSFASALLNHSASHNCLTVKENCLVFSRLQE